MPARRRPAANQKRPPAADHPQAAAMRTFLENKAKPALERAKDELTRIVPADAMAVRVDPNGLRATRGIRNPRTQTTKYTPLVFLVARPTDTVGVTRLSPAIGDDGNLHFKRREIVLAGGALFEEIKQSEITKHTVEGDTEAFPK
jgi:hypothetical protein